MIFILSFFIFILYFKQNILLISRMTKDSKIYIAYLQHKTNSNNKLGFPYIFYTSIDEEDAIKNFVETKELILSKNKDDDEFFNKFMSKSDEIGRIFLSKYINSEIGLRGYGQIIKDQQF